MHLEYTMVNPKMTSHWHCWLTSEIAISTRFNDTLEENMERLLGNFSGNVHVPVQQRTKLKSVTTLKTSTTLQKHPHPLSRIFPPIAKQRRQPPPPNQTNTPQATFSFKSNITGLVSRKLSLSSNFSHHLTNSGYSSFHLISANCVSTIFIIPSMAPAAISAMVNSSPIKKSLLVFLAFTTSSIALMAPWTLRSCRASHSGDWSSPREVSKNARPCCRISEWGRQ